VAVVFSGFRWLLSEVSKDFENISRRVEKDLAEQVTAIDYCK